MIAPGRQDLFTSLRAFLLDVLPEGVDAVAGQPNRVAEPAAPIFVVMSMLRVMRLRTNIDTPDDVKFTGSIAPDDAAFTGSIDPTRPSSPDEMPSGTMTVTAVASGVIRVGALVAGAGVESGTYVTGQISGSTGGIGVYLVSISQEIVPGSAMTSAAGIMNVTAVDFGVIQVGARVFGTGVTAGTRVRALGSATGGIGTYVVSPEQTISSETLSAGGKLLEAGSKFSVQLDFHSYDLNSSADLATTVQAAFRDPYATSFFADLDPAISPLYADDPRLVPFLNENQQIEQRWMLEANLQVNQTIRLPAQFADALSVDVISVDAEYPPA